MCVLACLFNKASFALCLEFNGTFFGPFFLRTSGTFFRLGGGYNCVVLNLFNSKGFNFLWNTSFELSPFSFKLSAVSGGPPFVNIIMSRTLRAATIRIPRIFHCDFRMFWILNGIFWVWKQQRMNEWMMEERTNKGMNEQTNERVNEGMNEWMNEWMNERTNENFFPDSSGRRRPGFWGFSTVILGCSAYWVASSGLITTWIIWKKAENEWMSEHPKGWMNEWMNCWPLYRSAFTSSWRDHFFTPFSLISELHEIALHSEWMNEWTKD